MWLGRLLWKRGDGWLIDGFGPDGVSARVLDVTRNVVRLQTGYLYPLYGPTVSGFFPPETLPARIAPIREQIIRLSATIPSGRYQICRRNVHVPRVRFRFRNNSRFDHRASRSL